jgi:hypothetical protein
MAFNFKINGVGKNCCVRTKGRQQLGQAQPQREPNQATPTQMAQITSVQEQAVCFKSSRTATSPPLLTCVVCYHASEVGLNIGRRLLWLSFAMTSRWAGAPPWPSRGPLPLLASVQARRPLGPATAAKPMRQ